MASHMDTSYGLQATQMNEEPPLESSLNLTLMQHPRDEDPKPQKVCICLKVKPLRTWYIAFIRTIAP